ncbi:MAG: leucine-rich repeat protein [Bacteroidales bacterium]|nr:leucine-rich repeat protein [Bacteroidales bacterium]
MNRKYILVAMVLSASILSSCTKEKEDNFEYKEVSASQVVSDLGISSSVVTFSITDGNGTAPTDVVALTGSEIDLPAANSFSQDGCDFDGWSTSFNGTPLEKDKDGKQKLKVEGNTVLYATWKARSVKKALDAEKVPEDGKLVIEEKNLTEWEFKQLKGLVEAGYTEIDLSKTEITEIPKGTFNFSEYRYAIPGDGHYYYADQNGEKLNFDGLKKITLPEKLKKIGESAFNECILLEEINFSKTALEEIGDRAFASCPSLKTLTLNEKVKTIGTAAFNSCSLTNVTEADPKGEKAFVIPNSVTSIGDGAFYGAEFTKIEVGEGLKLVRTSTFAYCDNLTEITFNYNGIDKLRINPNVFDGCEKLAKILYKAKEGVDLPANNYSIGVDVKPTKAE